MRYPYGFYTAFYRQAQNVIGFVLIFSFVVFVFNGCKRRFFPEKPVPAPTKTYYDSVSETWTCFNKEGIQFVTSDVVACKNFERGYSCEVGINSYTTVLDPKDCPAEQKKAGYVFY